MNSLLHSIVLFGLASITALNAMAVELAADQSANSAPTAAKAVAEIQSDLDGIVPLMTKAESLETVLVAFSRIGASLAVFEMRFGVRPEEVAGWDKIQSTAKTLRPRFTKLAKGGIYFNQDSAATAECMLLELSGSPKKALSKLSQIQPGGGCGNWIAIVMMEVADRQSGIYQRMGDYPAALKCMETSVGYGGLSLYAPNPDLTLVRHASY